MNTPLCILPYARLDASTPSVPLCQTCIIVGLSQLSSCVGVVIELVPMGIQVKAFTAVACSWPPSLPWGRPASLRLGVCIHFGTEWHFAVAHAVLHTRVVAGLALDVHVACVTLARV